MLNLLRMDLCRLKKNKSTYICLGILLLTVAIVYFLFYLMFLPEGQNIALKLGMLDIPETEETKQMFTDIDILLTVFICDDFKNGFIKNIMSVHVNRWNYIGSKMLALGIIDFIYLIAIFLFTFLMNLLIGGVVPYAAFSSVLFYFIQAWILTMAMLGLILMVCMLTRSITAGILSATIIGSGVIVTILYAVLGFFHANGWLKYSLYMSLSEAKSVYQSPADLSGLIVGVIFLILYTAISGILLKKKDI